MSAIPPTATDTGSGFDEHGLIDRAKTGDQAALGSLFDEHYPRVYRYLRSKTARMEDAEDLAQDVFVRMCGALETYQHRGIPFRSWLMQVASNLLKDYYRKRGTAGAVWSIHDADLETEGDPDPAVMVEVQLSMEEVTRAMLHLTELEREVVRLRYAAELSIAEAAAVLGRTENNIKQLTYKALGKLRKAMGERDVRVR